LIEAIESVLAQTVENWEYLLVDDGSTDASSAIAKSYAARYPEKIRHLHHPGHINLGMSAARNLGLRYARGEYLAFIDADDVWMPQKLAEQLAILDGNPEVGMVCGAVIYWSDWSGGNDIVLPTGCRQDAILCPPDTSLELYPLGGATAPCPSDLMVRTSLARMVGGFEEQFTAMYEDQAFLAKLYLATPVCFSSKIWLKYRQHSDSCMVKVKATGKYHEARLYFLGWFETYLKNKANNNRLVDRALQRALRPYRKPRVHYFSTLTSKLRNRSRSLGKFVRRAIH
jgi:glycosyltransferase involved in cell wall biosynthesis